MGLRFGVLGWGGDEAKIMSEQKNGCAISVAQPFGLAGESTSYRDRPNGRCAIGACRNPTNACLCPSTAGGLR